MDAKYQFSTSIKINLHISVMVGINVDSAGRVSKRLAKIQQIVIQTSYLNK